jgi:hypothetical protein
MGYLSAYDAASLSGDISYEQALEIHLVSNHYPPVSTEFVPACKQAIQSFIIASMSVEAHGDRFVYEQLEKTMLQTPIGMMSVMELVDALHLEAFIDYELEKYGI